MTKKIPNKPLSFVLGKDVPTKKGELQFAEKLDKLTEEELEQLEKMKPNKEANNDNTECPEQEEE